jgi:hypothetical protein
LIFYEKAGESRRKPGDVTSEALEALETYEWQRVDSISSDYRKLETAISRAGCSVFGLSTKRGFAVKEPMALRNNAGSGNQNSEAMVS